MLYEKVKINVDYSKANLDSTDCTPELSCYVADIHEEIGRKNRPAIVICPGGGYSYCSKREAEPVALRFLGFGINCFVLDYSCVNKRFPTATLELAAAVKYVRDNSNKFDIDPNKILVCGFSAGGHLAGTLSNFWNNDILTGPLNCKPEDIKPNGSILCYPVLTSGDYAHEGSILNIIGEEQSKTLKELVSLEHQVSEDTPKTFLWHTADDDCVPVENSLYYMTALSKYHIPYEAHIFDKGVHGLSLCDCTSANCEAHYNPVAAKWVSLAVDWIYRCI